MIKRLLILALLLPAFAQAQELFQSQATTTASIPGSAQGVSTVVSPIPYATIFVCSGTYTPGVSCTTGTATVYADSGLTTPYQQPITADAQGNFSFYYKTGANYYYTVSGTGVTAQTFGINPGSAITASPQYQIPYYSTAGTASTLTGDSGITTDGSGNLTASGLIPKVSPVYDIRAYGAVIDGTTDIGSALQSALNAASANGGGTILLPCGNTGCYLANSTTLTWPTTAPVTLKIQGTLKNGTTFALPLNKYVNVIGSDGASPVQFQSPSQYAAISGPTNYTTLGTAVSTAVGTADTVTFTPGSMTGLYAGTEITVANVTTCTINTITRTANVVTATFTGSCHIPIGVPVTVAGVTDTSFDGAYSWPTDQYGPWLSIAQDWVKNTLTWKQTTAADASSSGGTVTAFNEDSVEDVTISSCTATTCTATFYRPHLASDVVGIVGVFMNGNTHPQLLKNVSVKSSGAAIVDNSYQSIIENVGINQNGACTGNYAAMGLSFPNAAWITLNNVASIDYCVPYSAHFWAAWDNTIASPGPFFINGGRFLPGVKADTSGNNITMNNVTCDNCGRGFVAYDPTINWYSNTQKDNLTSLVNNDDAPGYTLTDFYQVLPTPSSSGGYASVNITKTWDTGNVTNQYFDGRLQIDAPSAYSSTVAKGVVGTFNDGHVIDGEIRGEGANFSPSLIPYATQAVTQPSSWTSGACTVATGVTGPDGSTTAASLTGASSSNTVNNLSIGTPAVGDVVLFGGWVYSPTLNATPKGSATSASLYLTNNLTTHYYFNYGLQTVDSYDANIANDWWHPVVGEAVVTSADGTSGQYMQLKASCDSAKTISYFNPWAIYIPASAGVSLAEINRWKAQLLHAYVPPSAVAGTLITDPALPIYGRHYISSGTPTIACGTGAGTSPTVCSIAGNDEAGQISVTTGTAPANAAIIATVTLHNACPTSVYAVVRGSNANAAALSGTTREYPDNFTATTWTITSNTTGLAASTAYTWAYIARCN